LARIIDDPFRHALAHPQFPEITGFDKKSSTPAANAASWFSSEADRCERRMK